LVNNKNIKMRLSSNIYIILVVLLSSCIETVALSSFVAGTTISSNKTIHQTKQDSLISAKINLKLLDNNLKTWNNNIEATVNNNRVLLTGIANSEKAPLSAQKLSWTTDGVKEVIDEIIIEDHKIGKIKEISNSLTDNLITSNVHLKIMFNRKLSRSNYQIITVNQNVFELVLTNALGV
jgi:osmotically-inducible protein OsmY